MADAAKAAPAAVPALSKTAAQTAAERLAAVRGKLELADTASVEQALTELADMGGEAAAQAIAARLRRGLPPQLTSAAIDALARTKSPSAAPVLMELTLHRRAPIRVKAIAALGALKARTAQSGLLYALDDPSPDVRAAAVQALGSVGNARALPALLTAAERGVTGAWQAVGSLATPADFKRMISHVSDADVSALRPALDAMMARSDLPIDAKLRTVQELEKLASPSVRACLLGWSSLDKDKLPLRVHDALLASIKRIDSGSQPGAVRVSVAASSGAKANQHAALAEAPAADREAHQ